MSESFPCPLCGCTGCAVEYQGPIRHGGVEHDAVDGTVLACPECSLAFLDNRGFGPDFYRGDAFRALVDGTDDIDTIRARYAHEQTGRVARIGVESLLGRSVADFGAGAGLFLAAVGGVASRTIAVEPNAAFRARLESEGHETYETARDIPDSLRVDVAVSFDTIEHVDDPLGFVRAMTDRLTPGGTLYLSMPNRGDILRRCFPEAFEPFMYQTAHTLYFDARSAAALMERSGLAWYRVGHLHKYGFDNLVRWARRHAPGSEPGLDIFDDAFAANWRGHMERLGLASHLFITGRKS